MTSAQNVSDYRPKFSHFSTTLAACGVVGLAACSAQRGSGAAPPVPDDSPREVEAAQIAIESPPNTPRPPFRFAPEDEALLDEVQRGCFNFLWHDFNPATGMVPDRSSTTMVSVAGVGFQLSAIPIGVERGWITRAQGTERALQILRALRDEPSNRMAGLFYHFLDGATAKPYGRAYEHVVSTIDSALLLAGVITASSYFGGEVASIGDQLVADADWTFFQGVKPAKEPWFDGLISLGWKPTDAARATGEGSLLPFYWADCGDEQRLVGFLAVAAPDPAHRAPESVYWRLRRKLGQHGEDMIAWFPWSGALFTSFFAHCWIDYAHLGPDDPAAHAQPHRARVDWWENSRRMVHLHRAKSAVLSGRFPTYSEHAWGFSASDCPTGYCVPGVFPTPVVMRGARPEIDFAPLNPDDDPGQGVVAPYAAGCSILFEPAVSVAALRHMRGLKTAGGSPLVWRDPSAGGWGFQDAFQLKTSGPGWVAADCVAIDQGPLILAIENARTGLIWSLFKKHPAVQGGMERLGMVPKP